MNKRDIKIFALEGAQLVGKKIEKILKIKLSEYSTTSFADGEVAFKSSESVRGKDTYLIVSMAPDVNNRLVSSLIFIDMLKRASPESITVVCLYYGYSRQDRKMTGRQPISAKLVADLLEKAGATSVVSLDLHNPSIQGFFNVPVDDIKGQYIMAKPLKEQGRFTVVSPDHGGAVRARVLAELIADTIKIAIVDKRRTGPNRSAITGILGNVKNKNCVIIDDIIDTGGTIVKAAEAIKAAGAKKVIIAATHGLFSKGFDKFDKSPAVDQVYIMDTIERVHQIKSQKLKIISCAEAIASAIKASAEGSPFTDYYNEIRKGL